MRVACIILNRNLPDVTDNLCNHLIKYDLDREDIFVIEAGSDDDKLSKFCTWHADWSEARERGLRYPRGMNFALMQLWISGRFKRYDAFFLLTNDTEFRKRPSVRPLTEVLECHPRVGLLSPCGEHWGEQFLIGENKTKYFWYIHNNAYLIRRQFIEDIMNMDTPSDKNFLFDGDNFRGYGLEDELIVKGYMNDWASAITTATFVIENESYLEERALLIKTESASINYKLYIEEGKKWMRKKYGFNSHWALQQYAKLSYDFFFKMHPELSKYKV